MTVVLLFWEGLDDAQDTWLPVSRSIEDAPTGLRRAFKMPRLFLRSSLVIAALSETTDSTGLARIHDHAHHLCERIGASNCSARSRLYDDKELKDEHNDDRSGMFARGIRGGGRRRNRACSVSMHEGVDLQAKLVSTSFRALCFPGIQDHRVLYFSQSVM